MTDPGWLDAIPADRPVLVIAEGLLMYLTGTELQQLLGRLTDHFPHGELIFDAISPMGAKMSKLFRWTLGDPDELERWNPRLTLVEQVPVVLMSNLPATRNYMRLLRYRFDQGGA